MRVRPDMASPFFVGLHFIGPSGEGLNEKPSPLMGEGGFKVSALVLKRPRLQQLPSNGIGGRCTHRLMLTRQNRPRLSPRQPDHGF